MPLTEKEFIIIKERILNILVDENVIVQNVLQLCKHIKKEKIWKVLKHLQSEKIIKIETDGRIKSLASKQNN